MAPPSVEQVPTVQRFTELIEALKSTTEAPIWYRGVGKADYQLIPLLYRHPTIKVVSELIELEGRILNRFRHRSIPYQDRLLDKDWEFLFLMQHYGVPTRLLDWSENPFIALYFAIADAETHCVAGTFSGDAAVWVLNTQVWNNHILSPYWKGRVLTISDGPFIDSYKPTSDMKTLASDPIAVSGLHNSRRIVAQRGVFTIFGHNNAPMEKIFEDKAFPPEALSELVLPQANLASLRDALFGMGYTDSMIYPDLSGLAKELKRQFGFEV
jgi:hypothetical protein